MITIIAVTYNHSIPILNRFISSLQCQSNPNFKCYIIHDGPIDWQNEYPEYANFDHGISIDFLRLDLNIYTDYRFEILETEERTGYWGHFNRQWAVNNLELSEFTHLTNADNFYCPNFIDLHLKRLSEGHDVVYTDFLHNYFEFSKFNAEFCLDRCDFVNFVVRSELLKKVGFNHPTAFAADGLLINELAAATNKISKIENVVLSVHC